MRDWVKVIWLCAGKLNQLAEILDKRIEKVALNTDYHISTMELINRLIKLNDDKILLINMKVLYEQMIHKLSAEEADLLSRVLVKKETFDSLAELYNRPRSSLYNRYIRAIDKCGDVCKRLAYSLEKLEEYFAIPIIKQIHTKVVRAAVQAIAPHSSVALA